MRDDKPKHKPSKKRTLEEVLKSLQDLIRNDFVPGATPEQPAPEEETAVEEPTAHAPEENTESITDALETLDQLITREIIEPVERARLAPPEPLTDETFDFEASSLGDGDMGAASLTSAPLPPEEGPGIREGGANDDNELIGAPDTTEPKLTAPPDDKVKQPKAKPSAPKPEARVEKPALALVPDQIPTPRPAQDFFAFDEPAPDKPVESITIEEPVVEFPTDEGEIIVMDEDSLPQENFPSEPPLVPPDHAPTTTLDTGSGSEPHFKSDHGSTKAEPMGAAHKEPARTRPPANRASTRAAPASAQNDIPVLNEVAEHGGDSADPVALPSANQARDIAIRVIAKLNIERRKAGEPALDIKAIERLQRILTDTLSRHESAGKPEGDRH